MTRAGRARFDADWATLATKFPDLDYFFQGAVVCIYGNITVRLGQRGNMLRTAPILIVLPEEYPKAEPLGFVDPETFKEHFGKSLSDRHFNQHGQCCFELISSWNLDDERGLLRWMENFVLFIHRQFIYDANGGRWPGPEWRHGADGWVQYVEEALPLGVRAVLALTIAGRPPQRRANCACGSGKSYAACHKRDVARVIREITSHHRPDVATKLLTVHAQPASRASAVPL